MKSQLYYAVGTEDAPLGLGVTEDAAWAEAEGPQAEDDPVREWPGIMVLSVTPVFAAYIARAGKWPPGYACIKTGDGYFDLDPEELEEEEFQLLMERVHAEKALSV